MRSILYPFKFVSHTATGLLQVLRGGSWRSSISLDAESAYVDSVWQEGGEDLCERDRHFHQVGATFRGKRITEEQHEELCNSVIRGLQLNKTVCDACCPRFDAFNLTCFPLLFPQDVLIDLCCGNGIVTSVLARHTSVTVGVDFSSRLLDVAQQSYNAVNISYRNMNLLNPDESLFKEFPPITKVSFHSAIQYFTKSEILSILLFFKSLGKGNKVKVRSLNMR